LYYYILANKKFTNYVEEKIMSVKDQARKMVARNRSQDKLREESVLGRAANEVGLSTQEATSHNWQSHIN
jgi:hypothetical protein